MPSIINALLDNLNQGIILIDKEYRVVIWNSWLERVSGLTKDSALGEKLYHVCPCFAEMKFHRILTDVVVNGHNRFCTGILHHAFVLPRNSESHKQTRRQNMQIEPIYYEGEVFALIQISDITAQYRRIRCLQHLIKGLENDYHTVKKAEENAIKSALRDSLTGLCNRDSLYDQLEYAMHEAEQTGLKVAVLFIDLDGFKAINDSYGHIKGDLLLKEVAARLKRVVRQTDTVARFAGDEFVVILANINLPAEAGAVAEKIRHLIADEPYNLNHAKVSLTASIGISLYSVDSDDAEALLKKADKAMYSVKESGKNGCAFYC